MQLRREPFAFGLQILVFLGLIVGILHVADRLSPRVPATWSSFVRGVPDDRARLQQAGGKVLYLGDSVIKAVTSRKDNRIPLYQMVASELGRELVVVSRAASAVNTFLSQVRFLVQARVEPALILIPINLHSFSPVWEFRRHYNFDRWNRARTHPFTTRALAVFQWPFEKSRYRDSRSAVVYLGDEKRGTIRELLASGGHTSRELMRSRYLLNYCTDIRRSARLRDLEELLELLRARDSNVFFYLTPINWEGMERLVPLRERLLAEANVAVIRGALERSGLPWADLSHLLAEDQFQTKRAAPSEHLTQSGREACARAIAREVMRDADLRDQARWSGPARRATGTPAQIRTAPRATLRAD